MRTVRYDQIRPVAPSDAFTDVLTNRVDLRIVQQVLGELLLQALFELLAEIGIRSLADALMRPRSPWLSTIGLLLWGAIAGGISLVIFPTSPIHNPQLRLANLLLRPLVVGIGMTILGRLRERRGEQLVHLDCFGYAFAFALSIGYSPLLLGRVSETAMSSGAAATSPLMHTQKAQAYCLQLVEARHAAESSGSMLATGPAHVVVVL